MNTRILITSDLHQHIPKWRELVEVVKWLKPRFVLIAGDLLPKDGGIGGQKRFFGDLEGFLRRMVESRTPDIARAFLRFAE